MGSHVWVDQCPCCGFREMVVSSFSNLYFEAACQICGYVKSTEERIPDQLDVELAKRVLSQMSAEERQKTVELYYEDNIPLVVRLKGNL